MQEIPLSATDAAAVSAGSNGVGQASAGQLARRHGLERVGVRPHFGPYLAQVWSRRHFAWMMARSKVAARSEGDLLGAFWNVLRPGLMAVVYLIVFGVILDVGSRVANFPAFLTIGVFIFTYTASCLTSGAKAITGNLSLVRALHFPRAVLPLSTTLDELISMGPVLAIMLLVTVVTGERPTWAWLLLVPLLLLQTAFNLGLALLFARLTSQVRDVNQLLPFATRLWLYLSGVFFSIEQRVGGAYAWLLELNPAHAFLSLYRGALLEGHTVEAWMWVSAAGWTAAAFVLGSFYFWRGEGTYGRG